MAAMMATITMRTVGSVLSVLDDDDGGGVAVVEVESVVVELEVEEGDSLGMLLEDGAAEVVGEDTVVVDIAVIQVPTEKVKLFDKEYSITIITHLYHRIQGI